MEQESYNTPQEDFTKRPVFWQIIILMVLLIVIFSSAILNELTGFTNIAKPPASRVSGESEQAANVINSQKQDETRTIQLADLNLRAEAVYVLDMQTGQTLYEQNANEALPLASVTKLMTALVATKILDENITITVDLEDVLQEGDSGLMGGEEFKAKILKDMVLMTSSNDGAHALAGSAGAELFGATGHESFLKAMNIEAENLGLDTLEFYNATGLDFEDLGIPGAVGSAEDVAKLMAYIVQNHPEILAATTNLNTRFYNEAGFYHDAQNTNGTVNMVTGLIGSKTGYTDLAGGNLVIAYEAGLNHPIVIAVLGSTRTDRFTDVLAIVDVVNDSFTEIE